MNKLISKYRGRFFHDAKGNLCIAQTPNIPLILWLTFTVLTKINSGKLASTFDVIAFGSLFTWAYLELFQGDCYFRRLVGLVVLVSIIHNRI